MFFGVFFVKPLAFVSSLCYNMPVASSEHDGYISASTENGVLNTLEKNSFCRGIIPTKAHILIPRKLDRTKLSNKPKTERIGQNDEKPAE